MQNPTLTCFWLLNKILNQEKKERREKELVEVRSGVNVLDRFSC